MSRWVGLREEQNWGRELVAQIGLLLCASVQVRQRQQSGRGKDLSVARSSNR